MHPRERFSKKGSSSKFTRTRWAVMPHKFSNINSSALFGEDGSYAAYAKLCIHEVTNGTLYGSCNTQLFLDGFGDSAQLCCVKGTCDCVVFSL